MTCPGTGTEVNDLRIEFNVFKDKGRVTGFWQVIDFQTFHVKTGSVSEGQATSQKYSIKGIENIDQICDLLILGPVNLSLKGQCGQSVPISLRVANGEKGDFDGQRSLHWLE